MNIIRKGAGLLLMLIIVAVPFYLSRDGVVEVNGRSPSNVVEMDGGEQVVSDGIVVETAVNYQLSPAARDLPPMEIAPTLNREINPRINPLLFNPNAENRDNIPTDPLIATSHNPASITPPLDFQFNGGYNPLAGGYTPPDTNGDVGLNHYVQMVNATVVSVYDKTGNNPQAYLLRQLWNDGSICDNDAGDPIVLYDQLAGRWLLSQFASPNHMCIAISQTDDPLGAFHLYTFNVGSFPDYFKFGVWPDGYYMSANEYQAGIYTAYAFDREKMLNGDPSAAFQKVNTTVNNLLLPSDVDGYNEPPPNSPNYFYTFKDSTQHGGAADRIEVYEFHTDWLTPANTTFTLADTVNLAPFTYTACGHWAMDCIRQQGTTQRLDSIGEWPMFRFPYRHFDDHETLLGTFNVGGGTGDVGAAIRWFELRKTSGGWTLHQEGTHDPNDGHDRWMSSIAMDGMGNIALGYSVSSSNMHPSIHYATRNVDDPLGTLQTEAVLMIGNGSQTVASPSNNRWGDYSAMSVDPANDCSFWYTNQYYTGDHIYNWSTEIGVFTIPECLPSILITPPALSSTQLANTQITKTFTISNSGGTNLTWNIGEDGSGGPPCVGAGDIPWITSITPNAGATLAGQSSTVDVQFDSGHVGPGVHTANLCVYNSATMNSAMPLPVTLTILATYDVDLSGNDAMGGLPGDVMTYTLSVTNTGNMPDTYTVTVSSSWNTTATLMSVFVDAGSTVPFDVIVTIPPTATIGSFDVARITVTSSTDGAVTDFADLTTTAVIIRHVYLPIILKP